MSQIGFSTGCLYKTELDIFRSVDFFRTVGSNAIELSLADDPSIDYFLDRFKQQPEFMNKIRKYNFISVHAPFKKVRYSNDSDTRNRLSKLGRIVDLTGANVVVVHPNDVTDFDLLKQSGLPITLENMDSKKTCGLDVKYFEEIYRKTDFSFVLDLKHVYEHDSSMNLALKFLEAFHQRLSHLHVSGTSEIGKHYPLYNSDNKDVISSVLKNPLCRKVPIVLEGIFDGNPQIAQDELDYIRRLVR